VAVATSGECVTSIPQCVICEFLEIDHLEVNLCATAGVMTDRQTHTQTETCTQTKR